MPRLGRIRTFALTPSTLVVGTAGVGAAVSAGGAAVPAAADEAATSGSS